MHEAHRDVEPTALPAGEVGHLAGAVRRELEGVEQLVGASPGGPAVQPVDAALARELVDGPLRVPGPVALPDVPDAVADGVGLGDDVVSRDGGGARRRPGQRGEHAQGGRLAGPVGAEDGDELARRDVEVDAPHGVHGAALVPPDGEVLGQCSGPDHGAPPGLRCVRRERLCPG